MVMGRRVAEAASTMNPADMRRLQSCLCSAARIGFVGSWLILGSGIPLPLVTATGRITPSRVLAHRASTPHAGPRPSCSCSASWFEIAHDSPQETDELARNRDDGVLRPLPISEVIEALVQSLLSLPFVRNHGW